MIKALKCSSSEGWHSPIKFHIFSTMQNIDNDAQKKLICVILCSENLTFFDNMQNVFSTQIEKDLNDVCFVVKW